MSSVSLSANCVSKVEIIRGDLIDRQQAPDVYQDDTEWIEGEVVSRMANV
jgi:hypothetical protein